MIKPVIYYTFLVFGSISTSIYAQGNLIRNPSFEDVYNNYCPDSGLGTTASYEIGLHIQHWQADAVMPPDLNSIGRNTPDYYNSCDIQVNGFGVPSNVSGYQDAKTGDAYMGIIRNYNNSNPNISVDRSEYLIQELETPLTAGITYSFSMFVSVAEYVSFGVSHLGAAFVEQLPFANGFPTGEVLSQITPQIEHTAAITDKDNWIEVSGNFTAIGTEKYVIIGWFKSHTAVTVIPAINNGDSFGTYLYIDDVSLTVDLLSNKTFQKEQILIYPNPTSNVIQISGIEHIEIESVTFYDMSGKKVLSKGTLKNSSVDISMLSKGTYNIKITTTNNIIITEKVVKE